jgi:hypothetical protein
MVRPRSTLALFFALTLAACNFGLFGDEIDPASIVCPCNCGTADEDDACFTTCKAPFDALENTARDADCADELGAYTQCLEDEGRCVDRSFDATACGGVFSRLSRCEADAGF